MGHNNQMDLEETESIVVVWVLLVQDSSTEMVINRRAPEKYWNPLLTVELLDSQKLFYAMELR